MKPSSRLGSCSPDSRDGSQPHLKPRLIQGGLTLVSTQVPSTSYPHVVGQEVGGDHWYPPHSPGSSSRDCTLVGFHEQPGLPGNETAVLVEMAKRAGVDRPLSGYSNWGSARQMSPLRSGQSRPLPANLRLLKTSSRTVPRTYLASTIPSQSRCCRRDANRQSTAPSDTPVRRNLSWDSSRR